MMRRAALIGILACALTTPVSAQKWIADTPSQDEKPAFSLMPPGWHVTTATGGGILFEPAHTATDRFIIEEEVFIFPGQSEEGYGVFVGGRDLESSGRSYIAFLARTDGSAGVFRFSGTGAKPIVAWTRTEAVLPPGQSEPTRNTLRVLAEPDSVTFLANGKEIAKLARSSVALDGHFGLRVGNGLNLHVSNLDITRRLAPSPKK
jgi:hypothetical protein